MANEFEQRKVICNNLRLIPLDEVQTVFRLSPSLFSQPCRFRRAVKSASFPPGEAKRGCTDSHEPWQKRNCLPHPSAAAAAVQLCMKRLYAVKDGYTR